MLSSWAPGAQSSFIQLLSGLAAIERQLTISVKGPCSKPGPLPSKLAVAMKRLTKYYSNH